MADPTTFLNGRVTLHAGDCLAVLPTLDESSVDSVVTDPPYHLASIVKRWSGKGPPPVEGVYRRSTSGFMNRIWDGGDIAFQVETWTEVLRVLKPGGYIIAFSSTRTFGRMSVAIEDAGFITHPFIAWIFGQGFPKAHNPNLEGWEGWRYGGQALKPAIEPIYMGQKPFSEKNGALNILKHGVGAINIDACRVEGMIEADRLSAIGSGQGRATANEQGAAFGHGLGGVKAAPHALGRWPANVILSDDEEVQSAFPDVHGAGASGYDKERAEYNASAYSATNGKMFRVGDAGGSAARFFYTAKADSEDRAGSFHPTVKPLDLMQYLVRLVTPPRGLILDPFAGTGTTAEAAWREDFSAIVIEKEAEYIQDIKRRMSLVLSGPDERRNAGIKARGQIVSADSLPLFGGEAA